MQRHRRFCKSRPSNCGAAVLAADPLAFPWAIALCAHALNVRTSAKFRTIGANLRRDAMAILPKRLAILPDAQTQSLLLQPGSPSTGPGAKPPKITTTFPLQR